MIAVAVAVVAGLALGSLGTLVVDRFPTPAPRCTACGRRPEVGDLFGGWFRTAGRCRRCGDRLSPLYPALEAVTGALFGIGAARIEPATDLVAYLPLFWVLVVLGAIDLRHKILPNRIVLPSIAVGIAALGVAAALGPGVEPWLRALEAAAASFAVFLALVIVSPRGMGMGDVKLAALLGLALGYIGWRTVYAGFLVAFVGGALGGILLILLRRAGLRSEVPFGPYLALGTVVAVLWGPGLGSWIIRV